MSASHHSDSNNLSGHLGGEHTLALMAGQHPSGELIVEQILVSPQEKENCYQLLKSPVFVRGIACGDIIEKIEKPEGAFNILQHSGNLCVRVFSKDSVDALEQSLTVELEKLGGNLDIKNERALVYSIHVSCGFQTIEEQLNKYIKPPVAAWFYGNVYDPDSGEPLDWWQTILQPE